jgi:predicted regulator of Ras-like GTPase activity (Roadblock/LC7/MglB family)
MSATTFVILESDHAAFMSVLEKIGRETNAKLVFLLDKAGRQIASTGGMPQVDSTSLASLAAGNVAATEGVAQLVGEEEFSTLFHEGRHDNLHISVIRDKVILLIVFDERSSLGLVRLRVDQCAPAISEVCKEISERSESGTAAALATAVATPFAEITDEDIDALFG